MKIEGSEGDPLGVLDRVTSLLDAFGEDDGGLGVSELALRSGLPKSTVSRLAATLVRRGLLEREGNRIHLGIRLFELGQLAEQPRAIRAAALPVMAHLRVRTGDGVHVAIRDGTEMVCIAALRGGDGRSATIRVGERMPIHATALGKAALAFSPERDVAAVLASGLAASTPRTIVDPVMLGRQLRDIRADGCASEVREYRVDVSSVASPVFSASGVLLGAIALAGAADGFDILRSGQAVRSGAEMIGNRLASATKDAI